MGMQIAKLKGAKLVIGTSTNDARRAKLKEYGADLAIDTRKPNWSEEVLKATGGKGVDVIIDMVSACVANENMKAAARPGPHRQCRPARRRARRVRFRPARATSASPISASPIRTRSPDELRDEVRSMRADIWAAVERRQARDPDRPHLQARRGRSGAGAYAHQRAFRQDRDGGVAPPLTHVIAERSEAIQDRARALECFASLAMTK